MIVFLIFIIILQVLSIVAYSSYLAKDDYPARCRKETIINLISSLIVVFWAINLIVLDNYMRA